MNEVRTLIENYWIDKTNNKEVYHRTKREIPKYQRFIREQLGWKLINNERIIKVEKIPAHAESFMGIDEFKEVRDYCILCALLMFLEDKEDNEQFLLSELVDMIEAQLKESMEIDWNQFVQRKSLIRVLQFAENKGMLQIYDGSREGLSGDIGQEILYENTGLSRYFATTFDYDIMNFTSYKDFETEQLYEAQMDRGHFRTNRVYRQLVSAPAMYWDEYDDQDSIYVKNQRQWVQKNLNEHLGGHLHLHKNAAFFVMDEQDCFGERFPKDAMLPELVLIVCCEIRFKVGEGILVKGYDECIHIKKEEFKNIIALCKEKTGAAWSKEYRDMSLDKTVKCVMEFMQNWMLIDGDRTPSRLDPFGSSDRKMEYYFLGNGDKDDVTGYLFLEFKKGDLEQYRTIGIGQRAQKGKPMDFWGFVILDGRRVGIDFDLYKKVGSKKIPNSKQELKNSLGEGNLVADKQGEYMKLVNKHIFGFPRIEQYEQFISLMIKVRAPKLSRDFKPTKVYEILNESLQTLSDEDLRAMVDAMEKMDDIQNKLDSLNAAFKDIISIRREYDNYNRYILSKKSSAYLSAKKLVDEAKRKLELYQGEVEDKTHDKNSKEEHNRHLVVDITILEKEKEILDSKDLESYVEKLENRKIQKADIKRDQLDYETRIEVHRQTIREYDSDHRYFKNEVETYESQIEFMYLDLNDINETLQYENHTKIKEVIKSSNVHNEFNELKRGIKELSESISKGLSSIQAFHKIEGEWNKAEEELSKLSIYKSGREEQLKTAEAMENQYKDSIIEMFYILAEKFRELVFGKQELELIVSKIMNYQGPQDIEGIREFFDENKNRKERMLLNNQAKTNAKRELIDKNFKIVKQELEELKTMKQPSPIRPEKRIEARNILKEEKIVCISLYEAMEFSEELTKEEQGLLEEQLLDTGLLDSLIVAKSDYEKARQVLHNLSDSLIKVEPFAHSGYKNLVVGDVIPELREAAEIVINNIYDHYEENAAIILCKDGYYKHGVIEGHSISMGEASFLGVKARKHKLAKMVEAKELEYSA